MGGDDPGPLAGTGQLRGRTGLLGNPRFLALVYTWSSA
jgi:hypothetical protein